MEPGACSPYPWQQGRDKAGENSVGTVLHNTHNNSGGLKLTPAACMRPDKVPTSHFPRNTSQSKEGLEAVST